MGHQNTPLVQEELNELNIVTLIVPKNIIHPLQPLDSTTNGKIKMMERAAFCEYLTCIITTELLENPDRDVSSMSVYFKLSTLKSEHLSMLISIYEFSQSEGKFLSGLRFTGTSGAVDNARNGIIPSVDPWVQEYSWHSGACYYVFILRDLTGSSYVILNEAHFNFVSIDASFYPCDGDKNLENTVFLRL